jgi:DNA replication protein DnaC
MVPVPVAASFDELNARLAERYRPGHRRNAYRHHERARRRCYSSTISSSSSCPRCFGEYEKVARECAQAGVDHPRHLLRPIELELIDRERRTRAARFPAVKSFDTFDLTAIPSLNKVEVLELARCKYILRRENVIALGNSGTGNTHVALALRLSASQNGFTVTLTTAASLVNQLMEARDERRLLKLQRDMPG